MASFSYEYIDKNGKKKKGTLEADSLEKARATVKADAMTILSLKEASALNKEIKIGGFGGPKQAKSRDLSVFCHQFKSLLGAGVSVVEALDMLTQQTQNKDLSNAIANTRASIQKGDTLSQAMRRCDGVFPDMLLNMIAAGESSGSLETSLERMAVHFEKETRLKGLVSKALIYPIILLIVAIGVLVLMLVKIIPSFMGTFAEMDIEMPAFTLGVMAVSDFFVHRWVIFVVIIAILFVAIKFIKSTPQGAKAFASFGLKVPLFGDLTMKTSCSRFTRTLSTLLASGMSLVEALEITSKVIGNILYEEASLNALDKVKQGQLLSQPLRDCGLFPAMVYHMVGIGEETGNMEEMLDSISDYYDEEVQLATEKLTAVLEPCVILFLAVIVIIIIVAVYGPIMALQNGI